MVMLELDMMPLDKGEHIGDYVAKCLDIIDRSGLDYRMGPTGTVIEGPMDKCMDVVKKCHEMMARDCARISTVIKMDYRRSPESRMMSAMTHMEERLGRALSH